MDGQHSKHGTDYAYAFVEWPEFYDLWVESLFGPGPAEDIAVFSKCLQGMINRAFPNQIITVLDVGTGTGRVIKDLCWAPTIKVPPNNGPLIKFVGMDHSNAMLIRAMGTFFEKSCDEDSRFGDPEWFRGSAAEFGQNGLPLEGKTDLVIFAAGGIGHLTTDGEVKLFLEQVRKVLRDQGGSVAIVSVLNEFIPGREGDLAEHAKGNRGEEAQEEEVRIASRDNLGLVYVKSPTRTTWEGSVRTDKFSVKAVKERHGDDSSNSKVESEVVWEKDMAWSVKQFDESAWQEEVQSSGLVIDSVQEGLIQRWYFLRIATE
jgi:SAM-dependent methyltransferase